MSSSFECIPSFINSKSAESVDDRQIRIASIDFTPKMYFDFIKSKRS